MAHGIKNILWLRNIMLQLVSSREVIVQVFSDNKTLVRAVNRESNVNFMSVKNK